MKTGVQTLHSKNWNYENGDAVFCHITRVLLGWTPGTLCQLPWCWRDTSTPCKPKAMGQAWVRWFLGWAVTQAWSCRGRRRAQEVAGDALPASSGLWDGHTRKMPVLPPAGGVWGFGWVSVARHWHLLENMLLNVRRSPELSPGLRFLLLPETLFLPQKGLANALWIAQMTKYHHCFLSLQYWALSCEELCQHRGRQHPSLAIWLQKLVSNYVGPACPVSLWFGQAPDGCLP